MDCCTPVTTEVLDDLRRDLLGPEPWGGRGIVITIVTTARLF